jgi:hypothetical protein
LKPRQQSSSFLGTSPAKHRTTTKNADHQAIPRFEQLVDLGFLVKPDDKGGRGSADGRRLWRYVTTRATCRWRHAAIEGHHRGFLARDFARTALTAFGSDVEHPAASPSLVARYLWQAYQIVFRPVGHTPLDSVALYGMVIAAADGFAIELADFHHLMLELKEKNLMPDLVFFASGNDLDKMFIMLKRGFVERIEATASSITLDRGDRGEGRDET